MLVCTNLPFLESMDHVLYRFFVERSPASSQAMLAYRFSPSFVHCVKSRMCRTVQVSASFKSRMCGTGVTDVSEHTTPAKDQETP